MMARLARWEVSRLELEKKRREFGHDHGAETDNLLHDLMVQLPIYFYEVTFIISPSLWGEGGLS